jgi:hypothetical protein
MTTLSRITLATILMGSLAMPVLAQSNAAPGVAGTPTTATKTAPQTNAANPVKSLHKTAGIGATTPSATKQATIHHAAATTEAAPGKTAPAKSAAGKDATKDTGATTGTPRTN